VTGTGKERKRRREDKKRNNEGKIGKEGIG
jgi:hypothetical protein